MTSSPIRFNDNHISVNQLQMAYICNLLAYPLPLIEPYMRDVGFSHVALVGKGCKLDPTLVSALVERWRPKMHKFHLSCDECTITLEDVQLQLELLVDGRVVTGSVHAADWRDVCDKLLRRVPEMIYGGRIEMGWLRRNFGGLDKDSTEIQIEQHAQAYIIQIIGCIQMSNKSRNLVHLRWLLKLVNFRKTDELNWGSTVLVTLYWEMCWAAQPWKIKIGGCMLLLQSWARYRLPFLRPRANYPCIFSLVTR
ncbi:hypothetical protein Gotur_029620 [Gossypium turneri]